MEHHNIQGVPDFESSVFSEKSSDYAVLIPVINEGNRILTELKRMKRISAAAYADIIICDGGSADGSMEHRRLQALQVNTLLTKTGPGRQGAQLRMGIWFALQRRYKGIITVDGNNKDSVENIPDFIRKLDEGYDLVQGSRYVPGGKAVNTPLIRAAALRLIHAPVISLTAHFHFTDTTNAYRGYSARYLRDRRVQPLRDVFSGYELLAYLSVRASQLGYKVCEIPVTRAYPRHQKTPTKISFLKGNAELMKILLKNAVGAYQPDKDVKHGTSE